MISHLRRDLAGVGYAWRGWMNARPIVNDPDKHLRVRDIYLRAQLADEFPGREPEMIGTSVRAGAKVMVREGQLEEYVWSGSSDEILAWVRAKGPLVFSTQWFDSMFEPDENGYVYPRGPIAGGHALCLFGVAANDDAHVQQSGGRGPRPRGVRKGRPEDLEVPDKPWLCVGLHSRVSEVTGAASPVRDLRGDRD